MPSMCSTTGLYSALGSSLNFSVEAGHDGTPEIPVLGELEV
jgi:hypothetical protein